MTPFTVLSPCILMSLDQESIFRRVFSTFVRLSHLITNESRPPPPLISHFRFSIHQERLNYFYKTLIDTPINMFRHLYYFWCHL